MRKRISRILAFLLLFSLLLPSVSAATNPEPRMMLVPFTYTTEVTFSRSIGHIGTATFEVTISGSCDVQSGYYATITSANCRYIQGMNCTYHEMYVDASVNTSTGLIDFRLLGETHFEWSDPYLNTYFSDYVYETAYYSFDPENYV